MHVFRHSTPGNVSVSESCVSSIFGDILCYMLCVVMPYLLVFTKQSVEKGKTWKGEETVM